VSVYLSVAPPDGFVRWGDVEWDRWLREHPWEAAERICSRGDWAIFLYQLRAHAPKGARTIEPFLEQLVNERPIATNQSMELRDGLAIARDELSKVPAGALRLSNRNQFVSSDDLEAMIAAAAQRVGREPTVADVWADVFELLEKVLGGAAAQSRGVYFGHV
jgi:hypothetical protein